MADSAPAEPETLDDVLLAMDVVDTLRHRERVVDHELSAAEREAQLIARLKEIYDAQGIDVPERILKDGVRALEEQRFVYKPPKPSLQVTLAKIYVSRSQWIRPLVYAVGAVVAALLILQFAVFGPRQAAARAAAIELSQTLPNAFDVIEAQITALTDEPEALATARLHLTDGRDAIDVRDRAAAVESLSELETLKGDLEQEYSIRIVSRPGEFSGFFRVPEGRPGVRNHYLVVEAVDSAGRVVTAPVTSEEDQATRRVSIWGLRVSESEFNKVADDKADDQIVQNALIGSKARGALRPVFDIETTGGAVFEW